MRQRSGLAVLCLVAVSACGAGRAQEPTRVAVAFEKAVTAGDGAAACALLAPGTRHELESSSRSSCAQAVLDQQLPASIRAEGAERYGDEARVALEHDTAFVAKFSIGWRVVAVGCVDQGRDRPYDCAIKGG